MTVAYKTDNVLVAARKRVAFAFDRYERVVVSVSGGKDSTVLWHLAVTEAERRGRRVEAFFLDQEAEYQATIDVIGDMMRHPRVDPRWYQVPIRMTNATSHRSIWLEAWYPGQEWMRPKDPIAIHDTDGSHPTRFYDFFPWVEARCEVPTAFLVGLRSKESFNRFRSISGNAGVDGASWTTRGKGNAMRLYPLYDWVFGDVWKYIVDNGLRYNRVYDWMFVRGGTNMSTMRVSNLIHEKAFKSIATLQEFEPDTYDRLIRRLQGTHAAALYALDELVFDADRLPASFANWRPGARTVITTWRAYRDYLVASTPGSQVARFVKRFAKQPTDEETCRQQVRQILRNDWENNVPVLRRKASTLRERWWGRL